MSHVLLFLWLDRVTHYNFQLFPQRDRPEWTVRVFWFAHKECRKHGIISREWPNSVLPSQILTFGGLFIEKPSTSSMIQPCIFHFLHTTSVPYISEKYNIWCYFLNNYETCPYVENDLSPLTIALDTHFLKSKTFIACLPALCIHVLWYIRLLLFYVIVPSTTPASNIQRTEWYISAKRISQPSLLESKEFNGKCNQEVEKRSRRY